MNYLLDEQLKLPKKIVEIPVGAYFLEIAPELPNWLVFTEKEKNLFQFLKERTIRQALEHFYCSFIQNKNECLKIAQRIIEQIEKTNFKADALSLPEEPIENIKKNMHIGTTNECNFRCAHCYRSAGLLPRSVINYEKTIELGEFLYKKYGPLDIVVSGGEPLMYSSVLALLQKLKENHITLFTNGFLINENNIKIINDCCDAVQISMEGISKESYESIRGKGHYSKVIHTIELLKKYEMKIILAITILPSTLDDINQNLISFVKNLNYRNVEVRLNDVVEKSGNALSLDLFAYNEEKSKRIISNLIQELRELGCVTSSLKARNIRFTNCGIGASVVINYDGFVYPCLKLSSLRIPNSTRGEDIVSIFNSYNFKTSNENMESCKNCVLRYICSGKCRVENLNSTGSMLNPTCDEKYKQRIYRKLIYDYYISNGFPEDDI